MLTAMFSDGRVNKSVNLPLKHARRVRCLIIRAVVLDHLIGVEYIGTNLAPPFHRDLFPSNAEALRFLAFQLALIKLSAKMRRCQLAVAFLRALALGCGKNPGRHMRNTHRSFAFVDILAAGTGGAEKIDRQTFIGELYL